MLRETGVAASTVNALNGNLQPSQYWVPGRVVTLPLAACIWVRYLLSSTLRGAPDAASLGAVAALHAWHRAQLGGAGGDVGQLRTRPTVRHYVRLFVAGGSAAVRGRVLAEGWTTQQQIDAAFQWSRTDRGSGDGTIAMSDLYLSTQQLNFQPSAPSFGPPTFLMVFYTPSNAAELIRILSPVPCPSGTYFNETLHNCVPHLRTAPPRPITFTPTRLSGVEALHAWHRAQLGRPSGMLGQTGCAVCDNKVCSWCWGKPAFEACKANADAAARSRCSGTIAPYATYADCVNNETLSTACRECVNDANCGPNPNPPVTRPPPPPPPPPTPTPAPTDCRQDPTMCSGTSVCDPVTGSCILDCRQFAGICATGLACDSATGLCAAPAAPTAAKRRGAGAGVFVLGLAALLGIGAALAGRG